MSGNAKVSHNNEQRYVVAVGLDIESIDVFLESSSLKVIDGRFLKEGDNNAVLIGYDYAYGKAFTKPLRTGENVLINDRSYKIIGIMDRVGNPQDDRQVYFTADAARVLFNAPTRVDSIIVQISQGEDLKSIAGKAEKKLRQFRDVDAKTQDFFMLTPEEILKSFDTILNILTAFLLEIGRAHV